MTNEYSINLEGMSDPVAIVSKAKENLMFAVAEMNETEKSSLSYTKTEFITKCSFNGRECSIEKSSSDIFPLETCPCKMNVSVTLHCSSIPCLATAIHSIMTKLST